MLACRLLSACLCVLGLVLCRASAILRNETAVDAVELFDRVSLKECEKDEEMKRLVPDIVGADPMAAALLIECRGRDKEALQASIDEVTKALLRHKLPFGSRVADPKDISTYAFSHDAKVRRRQQWVAAGGGVVQG